VPRDILRERIARRLEDRINQGMLDEVARLHDQGASWERLERLGLEYRYCSFFLQGKIPTHDAFVRGLHTAICHFAKRQETWFRGMEKHGITIHWIKTSP
jgi:tRNA dimethylallyltransferase